MALVTNNPLGPDQIMVVRLLDGDLSSQVRSYEYQEHKKGRYLSSWKPLSATALKAWIDAGNHVLWNPTQHTQYGKPKNHIGNGTKS